MNVTEGVGYDGKWHGFALVHQAGPIAVGEGVSILGSVAS